MPNSQRTTLDREFRIARELVSGFELDLHDLTVATEAATGHFRWTAMLALIAGAKRVVAIGKDSQYARGAEACNAVQSLAASLGFADRLEVSTDIARISHADIVTNLRALRPFDAQRIALLRPGTAIPYMCETWEYRELDLDLNAAFARDVLVLGTNEHHPALEFMHYVGLLAVRLAFEANVEVRRARVVVAGGGAFGNAVTRALESNGARVGIVCPDAERPTFLHDWMGDSLAGNAAREELQRADLLVFCDYTTHTQHIGDGALAARELAALNPSIAIAHISGLVDAAACRSAGLHIVPDAVAESPRTMSVTTGYLGVRPVLELHTAGLKVGEVMARAWRESGGNAAAARRMALANPLCQEFPAHLLPDTQVVLSNVA